MPQYDYNTPQYHVATRDKVTADLLRGIFPADRSTWDNDPQFLGWPAHLQRLHAAISEASARLVGGLETAIDLLENDHTFLDQALDQSGMVFARLNGEGTTKATVGKALEQAKVLNKILYRHTYDEESILIPAVLRAYA